MYGVYVHIPFCQSKCPYCDFYSVRSDFNTLDNYTKSLIDDISRFPDRVEVDSLYIGGGTPSVLGSNRLVKIIEAVSQKFQLVNPEITVEVNPSSASEELFAELVKVGVNRISMGMQSAVEQERQILGRLSDRKQVKKAVEQAKRAGIKNISIDLMIGVPFQTKESLLASIMFIAQLDVHHISAYMLKLEEGTFFYEKRNLLPFPDDDSVSEMYLFLCEYMEKLGFRQYEISNFAKVGYRSRHNLKYWHDEEYIGFGPSAHSFYKGNRYYYDRNLSEYIVSPKTVFEEKGGDKKEYAMLALRLTQGLKTDEYEKKYGKLTKEFTDLADNYRKYGFMKKVGNSYFLTVEGFLISNTIIGNLVELL